MLYNEQVKQILNSIIADMAKNKHLYVHNPDKDFTRNRKINFENTIKAILSMSGGSLNAELYKYFDRDINAPTSSAFIQQRNKLTEHVFVDLFHMFTNSIEVPNTYCGYRLFAVDGSDVNIAYKPDADTYIPNQTRGYKGYNQYHLNAIYDLLNKVYVDIVLEPRPKANERKSFIDMFESKKYKDKTLFIMDRGYPSWNMFAHFKYKENTDYLIRVQHNQMNIVKELPMCELDVIKTLKLTTDFKKKNNPDYHFLQVHQNKHGREYKSKSLQTWDFGTNEELKIRICRFKITEDTYETIFTSLSSNKFSIEEIKKLYSMRWGIETSFRELKYVIGLTNLHSKKDVFVRQEIYAKLTMYNFCESILAAVVVEQDENRKYTYSINYTIGMKICLDFYRCLIKYEDMYQLVLKYIVPIRPGRKDKRKLKHKTFVCFTYRVAA